MINQEINKLVRDKIPDIIKRSKGMTCDYRILSDEDCIYALECKLDEELAEYRESHELEELADLLEVIYALAEARGYRYRDLIRTRWKKVDEHGAFEKKIFLERIYEKEKK